MFYPLEWNNQEYTREAIGWFYSINPIDNISLEVTRLLLMMQEDSDCAGGYDVGRYTISCREVRVESRKTGQGE